MLIFVRRYRLTRPATLHLEDLLSGRLQGAYNGWVQGAYNGRLQGAYNGRLQGAYNGRLQGAYNGRLQGAYNGRLQGAYNGWVQGAYNGWVQGAYNGWASDMSPRNKVLLTLRFCATSSMQRVVGDLADVSVSSANRIIILVSREIALLKGRYISFPSKENIDTTKRMFYNIAQFPNKDFYSLNVQVVSNAEMFITNIVARWAGSSHNSRIFTNSQLGPKM